MTNIMWNLDYISYARGWAIAEATGKSIEDYDNWFTSGYYTTKGIPTSALFDWLCV